MVNSIAELVEKMHQHHRRSIHLREYDYSQPGSYFITICTIDKEPIFGEIIEGEIVLNQNGKAVEECWLAIPDHFGNIELDKFVVMPNHIHGIIVIRPDDNDKQNTVGAKHASPLRLYKIKIHGPKSNSIGAIIASFKSAATKQINILRNIAGQSIWQRNYYEHIIRDEQELNKIRRYVINNPAKWSYDIENKNGLPVNEKKFWKRFLNELGE